VIAIVVPNEPALLRYCLENNIILPENSNVRTFCANDQKLKDIIVSDLAKIGQANAFRSIEIPLAFSILIY
jgi:hypothetical protein